MEIVKETRRHTMPPSLNSLDLLAVGEVVVDFISSEPHPRLEDAAVFQRYLGGAPTNVAVTVAHLGGNAAVVSRVGPGPMGRFLRRELQRHGVRTEYLVEDPVTPSTLSLIARTAGTPDFQIIRGADAGYVSFAGWHPWGYGFAVEIDHGNGFRTLYAHLSWYEPDLGESVTRGQLIGGVGSTYGSGGWSSGSHLHFEIIHNGAKRNPCVFLPCP